MSFFDPRYAAKLKFLVQRAIAAAESSLFAFPKRFTRAPLSGPCGAILPGK